MQPGASLPMWLDEGLADYIGNSEVRKKQLIPYLTSLLKQMGVVAEAYHLCMMMRGVQKQNSKTITSAMRGAFLDDQRTRDEFLRLCMASHTPLSQ